MLHYPGDPASFDLLATEEDDEGYLRLFIGAFMKHPLALA